MKKLWTPCLKKLSARLPGASLTLTKKKLDDLTNLIGHSDSVAAEINQITKKLITPDSFEKQEKLPISPILADNLQILQQLFFHCIDVQFRDLAIGREQVTAMLIFIDGLADKNRIDGHIVKSLMAVQCSPLAPTQGIAIQSIKKLFLAAAEVREIATIGEITETILTGDSVLLLDGAVTALHIDTRGWESRDVSEPITESVVRGPREGFTENIRTNTALLRRRIKTPRLRLEKYIVGRMTKTEVNLAYLTGTADDSVLEEVRRRIERIDVDSILESAYIEELIEDAPYSMFPQIEHSERPDKVAAAILEGRVAIVIDGTPFVLIVPTVMIQFWQSSEDYYERYPTAWLVRTVRFVYSTLALLLPGIYVAITNFHQEMLPTALLINIAASHAGVPFPIYVEALLMEITFETLREAGVRLPQPVGQAVSIVGGLVIGEAAVRAGIVSPSTIIVVAITGISSFALPAYNLGWSLRLLRFVFGFLGFISGLYGILLGLLILLIHITSLRSFGVPYFTPLAPFKRQDIKDVFTRAPWWSMDERPVSISGSDANRRRQKYFLKPRPPGNSGW
ncbi:bacillus/clostridium ger spore germination protein [Lucifera butyrica]|uniref:Bacillus/clostridium ger spore germination protein n=1 Tax=Lucifera butyrica TaxID=1351585 RepID=A0A498R4N5_9FIRM|nr:spore germination protein [Lucifera butyrica]VBB05143.1 bacillus/clostridium ger spore germination protein [Lucifera butyrica]